MTDDVNIVEIPDDELDAMTPEKSSEYSARLWESHSRSDIKELFAKAVNVVPIVALGDSWFDYNPAGLDILDFLQRMPNYEVLNHGVAGDTLDNMVFGTEFKRRSFRPVRPRLEEVLEDIEDSDAQILIVSAGGNDIAGNELENLLNHADTGLPPIRQSHMDFLVNTVFRGTFESLFERVWSKNPDIQIIGHGYGNAIPDGRAVIRLGPLQWVGPWLRPALTKKRILAADHRQQVITTIITQLNDLLADLDKQYPNYHALDARTVINFSDWENELHLKNSAFRRVAMLFHNRIQDLMAEKASLN